MQEAVGPPQGRTRITLDYDRVRYSKMLSGLTNVLLQQQGSFDRSQYHLADVGEVHLGFENVFLVLDPKAVFTVRLGAWYDPQHTLEYRGPDEILAARFRAGKDQIHASAGLGIVIGESLQIDIGYDHSERSQIFSISLVKFF